MVAEARTDLSEESIFRLKAALKDPAPALRRIGPILEAGASKAFVEQRFGDFVWPPRYPNQAEPFINVAGALADFNKGATKPKARRFDRRPALRDTGQLLGSIRSALVGKDSVEVGTTVPYAASHQFGLVSTQPIAEGAKKRIAKWLFTDEGEPFKKQMTPLTGPQKVWDTEVVQRPFLGVTNQMEDEIQDTTEDVLAEEMSGGGQ